MVGGFTLFGDATIQAMDSKIGMIDLSDRSSARATNTLVGRVYKEENGGYRLDNCTAEYLLFWLQNSTGTVKLRANGFVSHRNSKTDSMGFPNDVELSNTTLLKGIYPIYNSSNVRFVDPTSTGSASGTGDS
jgi:hypothetical protein